TPTAEESQASPQQQQQQQHLPLPLSVPTPQSIAAMLAVPTDDGSASSRGASCGFECRCGGTYCPAHRYSDKHDCSFDYRSHGRHEIRKANPQIEVFASKI
uniref:AN1-type domain-containing protein n=1 Tax=Macrostomum lignano TaxID=282301 RepID=A0A1I8GTE5_9PLAT